MTTESEFVRRESESSDVADDASGSAAHREHGSDADRSVALHTPPAPEAPPTRARRFGDRLVGMFGADLRSFAALRVVLAVTVLIDLFGRSLNLTAHYTDSGIFPRWVAMEELGPWYFSLHLFNGTAPVQGLLFGVAALAAVGMLVGWHTRLMTVLVWLLTVSLQWRNPTLLNGGDMLLRVLLFWSLFLPLGAVASVDRMRGRVPASKSPVHISVASVAFFLQIAFMYWFTAVLKSGPEWRSEYTATYIALSAEQNVSWLGALLYPNDAFLRMLTFATLWLEALGPFLLFFPFRTAAMRMFGIVSFVGLQVGIATTMAHMGLFNWFSAAIMVAFLPTVFWDRVLPWLRAMRGARVPSGQRLESLELRVSQAFPSPPLQLSAEPGLQASLPDLPSVNLAEARGETGANDSAASGGGTSGAGGGSSASAKPSMSSEPAQQPQGPRWLGIVSSVLAAFFLVFVVLWNVATVTSYRVPEVLRPLAYLTGLRQAWDMYAPRPYSSTSWVVVPGELFDGTEVDLLAPLLHSDPGLARPVSWEKPADVPGVFKDKYWSTFLGRLGGESNDVRLTFGRWICREWNAVHGGTPLELDRFDIVKITEETLADYKKAPPRHRELWRHRCR